MNAGSPTALIFPWEHLLTADLGLPVELVKRDAGSWSRKHLKEQLIHPSRVEVSNQPQPTPSLNLPGWASLSYVSLLFSGDWGQMLL